MDLSHMNYLNPSRPFFRLKKKKPNKTQNTRNWFMNPTMLDGCTLAFESDPVELLVLLRRLT